MAQEPEQHQNSDQPYVQDGQNAATAAGGEPSRGGPPSPRRFRLKSRAGLAVVGMIAVLVLSGVSYAWYTSRYESTDDAQVEGHIDPVSARVAGHIARVAVDNGQAVKAGTLLALIDPADYQKAYERAKAAYQQAVADYQAAQMAVRVAESSSTDRIATARAGLKVARSGILTSRQAYKVAQAELAEAQAQDALARKNLARAKQLVDQKVISRQDFDQYETTARSAAASLAAGGDKVEAAAKAIAQARARFDQAKADLQDAETSPDQAAIARSKAQSASAAVEKARAEMAQAELNLQYTRITAPADGVIGNKNAETGQNVAAGQVLMDLVQVNDVWVRANFRETQLRRMRPGQPVTIHVDAFDKDYKGRVDSIGAATGEQFSLFPPENATGNYVKVVQRVPVKIVLNSGQNRQHLLRPGMSVEPEVWIK